MKAAIVDEDCQREQNDVNGCTDEIFRAEGGEVVLSLQQRVADIRNKSAARKAKNQLLREKK